MTTTIAATTAPTAPTDAPFNIGWAAWQARGAAQDKLLNRRASLFGLLLACGFGVALAVAIYAG